MQSLLSSGWEENTQLLPDIEHRLPSDFSRREIIYVEPFVGGGAVMFWLLQSYPNIQYAVINDINERLINVYKVIKTSPHQLIEVLRRLEGHLPLSHEERTAYFGEKCKRFNDFTLPLIESAALFINTSFASLV